MNEPTPTSESPFHAGERALQMHTGVAERVEEIGRMIIRDHMPEQHRELFEKLPFMIVGSLDAAQQPWASIVLGLPGFVQTPDAQRLVLRGNLAAADPLRGNLAVGTPLGMLGIEPQTRRRNRVNGVVTRLDADGFEVRVAQSFGNCPKYIQARAPSWSSAPETMAAPRDVHEEGALLSAHAVQMIEVADTFFIASASAHAARAAPGAAGEGVDVSHRGGKPGFVRVTQEGAQSVLTVPDFIGNFLFNTLGNLLANPSAGLLFVDFDGGDLLWLQAQAEIVLQGPELDAFAGAQRLLRLKVTGGRRVAQAVPLRWSAPQPASQLAATGAWTQVQDHLHSAR
jgi:predicted pyridoxine 5'-phosphate oxidase superfamily flavin-nucleotide-binding protein